ncbi:MAG: 16S rRNA (uracil(1498)-N(3))-methyltransferase [Clostridia bacterium]|nr:16S rRNA (uracil(1498)-N(3))-methyltransferase [Clostridia bacterium]
MFNFFVQNKSNNGKFYITGGDYNHIKSVLRLKVNDSVLVSAENTNYLCKISGFTETEVVLDILEENYLDTSLPIEIYLFQGLPKSDKLELIIQKAVELGVSKIVPVEMQFSVAKIEEKKKESKTARFNAIAESSAKQCKRAFVPEVLAPLTFKSALELCDKLDLLIVPYECALGMEQTKLALSKIKSGFKVGVMIGPEGGFSEKEIELVKEKSNTQIISLGKRILRTETASITVLSMLMLYAEINL